MVAPTRRAHLGEVIEYIATLLGPVAYRSRSEDIRRFHPDAKLIGGICAETIFQECLSACCKAGFANEVTQIAAHGLRMIQHAALWQGASIQAAKLEAEVDDVQGVGRQVFDDTVAGINIFDIENQ